MAVGHKERVGLEQVDKQSLSIAVVDPNECENHKF